MEYHLAERGAEFVLVGQDDASDQVDHRVLGIEPDGFIAVGQSTAEIVRVPESDCANEVDGWRIRIQADGGAGVTAIHIGRCEARIELDGGTGIADGAAIVNCIKVRQSTHAIGLGRLVIVRDGRGPERDRLVGDEHVSTLAPARVPSSATSQSQSPFSCSTR